MTEARKTGKKTAGVTFVHPDASWFVQARFGMFIHWGLYAMAARHEWVRSREGISKRSL